MKKIYIHKHIHIENIKWLQWVINYKRSTLTSSSIFKGWSPMGFPMVSRRQMPRAPFPSERMRMTIRNPRHMDGFWIRMGLLAEKDGLIRQRMGRLLRGKKTWQKPRKIEEFPWDNDPKYDGFPMDFLISCVTLIRFAWGGWAKGGSICVLATWCCPLKLVYFQSVN